MSRLLKGFLFRYEGTKGIGEGTYGMRSKGKSQGVWPMEDENPKSRKKHDRIIKEGRKVVGGNHRLKAWEGCGGEERGGG